jgi:hypothetical protein
MLGLHYFLKQIDNANSFTLHTGTREKKWNEIETFTRDTHPDKIKQIQEELQLKIKARQSKNPFGIEINQEKIKKPNRTHHYNLKPNAKS